MRLVLVPIPPPAFSVTGPVVARSAIVSLGAVVTMPPLPAVRLIPVAEGRRAKVLRLVREAFSPAPVPQRP